MDLPAAASAEAIIDFVRVLTNGTGGQLLLEQLDASPKASASASSSVSALHWQRTRI